MTGSVVVGILLGEIPKMDDVVIPMRPKLVAEVKFLGRYRGGWIRDDGVLLSVG